MTASLRYEDGGPPFAQDTLIFRVSPTTFSLVGGTGRGVGWSGIVDLPIAAEPVAGLVNQSGRLARVDGADSPVHVVGPYWARHAVLIPVGGEHLVVFGGPDPIEETDAQILPMAASVVADLQQVSPSKLLADELEVVHAMRALMDHRPEDLVTTARHVALMAAAPLSCEVGAVLVRTEDRLVAEVVTREWPARLEADIIRESLIRLFERAEGGAILEQELEAGGDDALGREQGLVARFAVPIGSPKPFGVLVVAHAADQARGFTNLCQRIGHALATAAESLLVQAMSREALSAERDRFAREARIDHLTGLENRMAWEDLVSIEEARRRRYPRPVSIISADVDHLKATNDRDGHAAGDDLIRTAASLLRGQARTADRVARVGGDEFMILLPETDRVGARRFMARIRSALLRADRETSPGLSLSIGGATAAADEPLSSAIQRADAAMYAAKKRRAKR